MSFEKDIKRLDAKRFGAAIKDTECRHEHWTKRCSICNTVLETEQNVIVDEAIKKERKELESLVVSYQVAKMLGQSSVTHKSALYWVHFITSGHIGLRAKENLTLHNTEIYNAYTSQELCALLKELDVEAELILEQCTDPDALATTLIAMHNIDVILTL